MKKILFLLICAIFSLFAYGKPAIYKKCIGSIEKYDNELLNDSAEIIIVSDIGNKNVMIFNHYGTSSNIYTTTLVNDSIISCDDNMSLYASKHDSTYGIRGKYDHTNLIDYIKFAPYSRGYDINLVSQPGSSYFSICFYKYNAIYTSVLGNNYTSFNETMSIDPLEFASLSIYRLDTTFRYEPYTVTDTIVKNVHDTVNDTIWEYEYHYDSIPYHDTLYDTIYSKIVTVDTVYKDYWRIDTMYRTLYDTIHKVTYDTICWVDTVYRNRTIRDTVYKDRTVYDTITNMIRDTVYKYIPIHDTITNMIHDTVYKDRTVYDTITNMIRDTVYKYIPIHDTITNMIRDTICRIDTVYKYIPIHDTITNTIYDTIPEFVHDTIPVLVYDTVYQIDTVYMDEMTLESYVEYVSGSPEFYYDGEKVVNENKLALYLYSMDGKLINVFKTDIYMTYYVSDMYIVADQKKRYIKIII